MRFKSFLTGGVAALALAVPSSAAAQANPYQRGPAPTVSSVQASQGAFATARVTVSDSSTPGFGSATIHYPTSTTSGTFGGLAISPGFTASESSIAWMGPRFASHGFVVITFNTNSRYDQPSSRGDQLRAALDYLTQSSSVRTRVDASRLSVAGHSMGGGGALEAAKDRPSLQAAIGLTPYNRDKSWPEVTTPSLMVGAENDSVASPSSHAIPFYNSIASRQKAYLELNNASHSAPNSPNTTIAASSISWLKRFVDDDTRYSQFLCPNPSASPAGTVSAYSATCPF